MDIVACLDDFNNRPYLKMGHLESSTIWYLLEPLAITLNIKKPRQLLYHYTNSIMEIPTCKCGDLLQWHDDNRLYRKFCSKSCTAKYSVDEKKKANIQQIGVEWHSQLPSWKSKVEETNTRLYGEKYYSQTEIGKSRVRDTNLERWGVAHPAQNPLIMEKIMMTNREKYGHDCVLQSDEIKNKITSTLLARYGVDNAARSPEIREKIKASLLDRYGVDHQNKNKNILDRGLKTKYNKRYSESQQDQLEDRDWLENKNKSGITLHELADIIGVSPSKMSRHFRELDIDVIRHSKSSYERQLFDHFTSLNINVITNERSILNGKEIDIYFPDYKFGVEVNGIYWHSEQFFKDKNFHLKKSELAERKGITLYHFWDWELDTKLDVVLSKISHRLGISSRIYARNCSIRELTSDQKKSFFNANHIQGDCRSSINIGLFDTTDRLVMAASFGKSRFNKNTQWELLRLTSLNGYSIVGGASKLWSSFKSRLSLDDYVITYGNRRFGDAVVYNNFGFEFSHYTEPGYFYSKAGKYAGSRNMWQKKHLKDKLSIFDETFTESENMMQNGYYRVWDCGNTVHIYNHIV